MSCLRVIYVALAAEDKISSVRRFSASPFDSILELICLSVPFLFISGLWSIVRDFKTSVRQEFPDKTPQSVNFVVATDRMVDVLAKMQDGQHTTDGPANVETC
jgi:hypothetical protein